MKLIAIVCILILSLITVPGFCNESVEYQFDNGLKYIYLENNTIEITGYINNNNSSEIKRPDNAPIGYNGEGRIKENTESIIISIPDRINGFRVKSIGEKAFANCKTLSSIELPDGLERIGNNAFEGCNIQVYYIPSSVNSIGNTAFDPNDILTTDSFQFSILENNTAEIRSYCGDYYRVHIPSQLNGVSVTSIGEKAFADKLQLSSFELPNSLLRIGNYAFSGCGISEINIPGSVVEIGNGAFANCPVLMQVLMGEGIKSIGQEAFSNCKMLTNISLPQTLNLIGSYAFFGCKFLSSIIIPKSVKNIGINPFAECSLLSSILLPDHHPTLAFENGALLSKKDDRLVTYLPLSPATEYTIPSNVRSIDAYAFYGCDSLTTVHLHDKITYIGYSAFNSCSYLTKIEIPKSVETIEPTAFTTCSRLRDFSISEQNKTYSFSDGLVIEKKSKKVIGGIQSITGKRLHIPDDIEIIGENAFDGWVSLSEVVLGKNVSVIEDKAFYDCTMLERVYVRSTIQSVGKSVFEKTNWWEDDWLTSLEWTLRDIKVPELELWLEEDLINKEIVLYAINHDIIFNRVYASSIFEEYEAARWIDGFNPSRNTILDFTLSTADRLGIVYENDFVEISVLGCTFLHDHNDSQWYSREWKKRNNEWMNCICFVVHEKTNRPVSVDFSEKVYVDEYLMKGERSSISHGRYYNYTITSADLLSRIDYLTDIGEIVLDSMTIEISGQKPITLNNVPITVNGKRPGDVFEVCDYDSNSRFLYRLDGDDAVLVSYEGDTDYVKIPERIEQRYFTGIDSGTFRNCLRIDIPSSIANIADDSILNLDTVLIGTLPETYADHWANQHNASIWYFPSEFDKDGIRWRVSEEQEAYILEVFEEQEILNIPSTIKKLPVVGIEGEIRSASLKEITFPEGLRIIGECAFDHAWKLESIELPNSLISIEKEAFKGCTALKSIVFPDGIVSIGENAFEDCENISSLSIPESVQFIGNGAFSNMLRLESIFVSPENLYYADIDGVLYNKVERILLMYPCAKKGSIYKVPNGITGIADESISNVWYLEQIQLASTVKSIGDYAICEMENLKSVVLPNGLETIGNFALCECPAIQYIKVPGSVKSIGHHSFSDLKNLTLFVIDEGVQYIEDSVLSGNQILSLVYLPSSLTHIGNWFASNGNKENTTYLVVKENSYAHEWAIKDQIFNHVWLIQRGQADASGQILFEDASGSNIYFDQSVLLSQ